MGGILYVRRRHPMRLAMHVVGRVQDVTEDRLQQAPCYAITILLALNASSCARDVQASVWFMIA